jgi:hypothetical protein
MLTARPVGEIQMWKLAAWFVLPPVTKATILHMELRKLSTAIAHKLLVVALKVVISFLLADCF